MIEVREVSAVDDQAQRLLCMLDEYLLERYPAESNHIDDADELTKSNVVFVMAFEGKQAVGCGAVKWMHHDLSYGEIKRLFVPKEARGLGCGKAIMDYLEQLARKKRIFLLRLEAGVHQPEALGLYKKLGFGVRKVFGGYPDDPLSVFMEKTV